MERLSESVSANVEDTKFEKNNILLQDLGL